MYHGQIIESAATYNFYHLIVQILSKTNIYIWKFCNHYKKDHVGYSIATSIEGR